MNQHFWQPACPFNFQSQPERITLAYGEGGRLMRRLIQERIVPRLRNTWLTGTTDGAALPIPQSEIIFTTDSFVVSPLFFPGGDIGSLAIFGTVNDLVVSGAQPRWISLAFIIEEGLELDVLDRVLESIADAASRAGVQIVTGDTKVVPRGAADGLFINTSGIGEILFPAPPGPSSLSPGDELIVSGPIGSHGIAILACRENLGLEPAPRSDCAPLIDAADALRQSAARIVAMRDATRGGVAAVLHEWADESRHTLTIDESAVPVNSDIRGACELLGLDPLHIANEGTLLLAVEEGAGRQAVSHLRQLPGCIDAAVIGRVRRRSIAPVTVIRSLGVEQPLDEPTGSPLPRIC
jgi:hydrogenase expression/formation protein HypE